MQWMFCIFVLLFGVKSQSLIKRCLIEFCIIFFTKKIKILWNDRHLGKVYRCLCLFRYILAYLHHICLKFSRRPYGFPDIRPPYCLKMVFCTFVIFSFRCVGFSIVVLYKSFRMIASAVPTFGASLRIFSHCLIITSKIVHPRFSHEFLWLARRTCDTICSRNNCV